jgi:hypothetical protein
MSNFQSSLESPYDEIDLERKQIVKNEAQISAAKRSNKTNLILGILFFAMFTIVTLTPKQIRPYFASFIFSVMKTSMPVFTTIANFGTIQFVLTQYWNYFKQFKMFQLL